jgi:hypothetical protein
MKLHPPLRHGQDVILQELTDGIDQFDCGRSVVGLHGLR